jgi:CxxC motif-containing protein (DUF1111 family)
MNSLLLFLALAARLLLSLVTLAVASRCSDDALPGNPRELAPSTDARAQNPDVEGPAGNSAEAPWSGHGPIAPDVSAALGQPLPRASAAQLEAFERGRTLLRHRFTRMEGLGPAFNVTFCGACHEKPMPGGSAGLYRNYNLSGIITADGAFLPGESAGMAGGVLRLYFDGRGVPADEAAPIPPRPPVPEVTELFASRNPIPFFGAGLLAELTEEEILRRADPDDSNGDRISGRPNYDQGYVGRFGRKAQSVSVEAFARDPLFNHVGITSNPLSEELRAKLLVDSSRGGEDAFGPAQYRLRDDDGVPDPEIDADQLFDIVSFVILLAAPRLSELDERAQRGGALFDELRCGQCHTPRLDGPRGPLPVYSDLLLHDMGPELADGVLQREARGAEYRTQPLWGLAAVGPYLHDGRASTISEAIRLHGGEAQAARDAFEALPNERREDLLTFLDHLGGREQASPGLLPPHAPAPAEGELGGPISGLNDAELRRFAEARRLFDREFRVNAGLGSPRFNGDSCRACHFDPVLGGSGPRDVDVMRHGVVADDGSYTEPAVGSILHRASVDFDDGIQAESGTTLFELRQTPHLFGGGLIELIPRTTIEASADPEDANGDGISGRAALLADGRLGRFGWKAQVPSLLEFVREAATDELGLTVPVQPDAIFGRSTDSDDTADPELSNEEQALLAEFLERLAPPPRGLADDPEEATRGEALFGEVGCSDCHIPALEGASGPVRLYSDLLLHAVAAGDGGIDEGAADRTEYRTAPLWGIRLTGPFMHDGAAETLSDAITQHAGEAANSSERFLALGEADKQALLAFLNTL